MENDSKIDERIPSIKKRRVSQIRLSTVQIQLFKKKEEVQIQAKFTRVQVRVHLQLRNPSLGLTQFMCKALSPFIQLMLLPRKKYYNEKQMILVLIYAIVMILRHVHASQYDHILFFFKLSKEWINQKKNTRGIDSLKENIRQAI